MSLLPLLFSAWWADLDRPHRLFDQNFGLGVLPEQLMMIPKVESLMTSPLRTRTLLDLYYRPMADALRTTESGTSTITADKDMFKVMLDVQQFKPDEISVKVVDKFVVVEAKHEEKRDEHGLISRQFIRKYLLPEQADVDQVSSNISSDGILTVMAPLKQLDANPNEKTIKIELTGKPALRPDETKTTKSQKESEEKLEEKQEEKETPTPKEENKSEN